MLSQIEIVDLIASPALAPTERAPLSWYDGFMSPDVRVLEPRSLPYGGVYQGKDALAERANIFDRTWANHRHVVRRYVESGDHVVAYLDVQLTSRTTGDTVHTHITQWWRFIGGKIVEIEMFYADTAMVLAAIAT